MDKKIYPEGHYIGAGIAIGLPIGIAIGFSLGNFAIGPGIGVAIGLSIGAAMENKAKKEGRIRPLTIEEKKIKKRTLWIALGVGFIMLALGIGVFFLVR
jgi:hypothetical protein|tara:strand:- start:1873 stop:2169 length:297 start_codon:yes stop_codon:yes gene_type:complete